ncbi:MAG: hypothetical protein KAS32_17520 [Candidatus Peribacteraceae bacterium]|nr:hypothetical protein [Candidatus Peribacteraceae bacterium]
MSNIKKRNLIKSRQRVAKKEKVTRAKRGSMQWQQEMAERQRQGLQNPLGQCFQDPFGRRL